MCSIGEDDFGDEGGIHSMTPEISSALTNDDNVGICNKCGREDEIYKLSCRKPECRDCFLTYVRHKFRATLGSSKVIPRNANILIIFDSSPESIVLLDMLSYALEEDNLKRLQFNSQILYIDDTYLKQPDLTEQGHQEHILSIRDFLALYAIESYIISIGSTKDTLLNFREVHKYLTRNVDQERNYLKHIASIGSLTSRQDFIKTHINRLIAISALHFKCDFACVPDISSSLAAHLLSAIVLGRGGSAACDVSLVDDRLGNNLKLVRPIKELNITEVQLYLRAQNFRGFKRYRYGGSQGGSEVNLQNLTKDFTFLNHSTRGGSEASLQNLTKAFVDNLQQNYSSTVSTVYRTGNKITSNSESKQKLSPPPPNGTDIPLKTCTFCNSSLDYSTSTTLLAMEFSRLVSETGATLDKCPDLEDRAYKNLHSKNESINNLCHACRNIQSENENKELLLDYNSC